MKYKRNIRETNSICNKEKRKHVPLIEDQFRKEVIKTEGPIGFPLCAHLYFFGEEYQTSGASFFL